jgi:16S rRNA (uracil1498-N3)-methyltransferase
MTAFFTPSLKEGLQTIDGDEALHCSKVLRKKAGDSCLVFDGSGVYHLAKLTNVSPKQCAFDIIKTETILPQTYKLNIAISPTKNMQRFEWFLEKAIEMGVNKITPIICERSERKHINKKRCEKVIISAAKQSGNFQLPEFNEVRDFKELLSENKPDNKHYIAYCSKILPYIKDAFNTVSKELTIFIGPEGDFTNNEIDKAISNEFIGIGLGNSRLRTETAGVFCCAHIYDKNQI